MTGVNVPFPDYLLPVGRPYDTLTVDPAGGLLKLNATDYLLTSGTDRIILRSTPIVSPVLDVPAADYQIPVPQTEWA